MFDSVSYFRWQDVLDILVVAFIIHQLVSVMRGTRSVQMVVGIGILTLVYFLASVLHLSALLWVMQTFLSSILLIVIIVFQKDIRRALTQVGRSPFQKHTDIVEKQMEEIIRTLFYLSKRRIGALIVIERETSLGDFIESGFKLDALLTKELLISVFMPASPLHDGAVLINRERITHAGCILPLTQNPYINKRYGTRHRAAIGLTEETDAVVLVVSEETQEISIVRHGALTMVEDEITLKKNLQAIFVANNGSSYSLKHWMGSR